MCPFAIDNTVLDFKTNHDPPLTTEIDGAKEIESIFDIDDCDPVLSSIFDPPDYSPAAFNIFDNSETISIFKELEYSKKNEDGSSHYTATTVNTADDRDMLNSDFYYSSPSSKLHFSTQDNDKLSIKSEFETTVMNDHSVDQMLQDNITSYLSGQSPVANDGSFLLHPGVKEKSAKKSERVSNSIIAAEVKPQKMHYDKYLLSNMPFKIQKPRQAKYPDLIQNIVDFYNMELNYILRSESSEYQNTATSSLSSAGRSSQNKCFTNETKVEDETILDGQKEDILLERNNDEKPATSSRPRKEKRMKCLKRDSTATLQEKLQYFNYIMEEARSNGRSGIFLRDQAASELSIKKHEHHSLELIFSNFDEVERDLEKKMETQCGSFRTIWRIVKWQEDHNITLKFLPSNEMNMVQPEDMEISVFTLIMPGHSSKHLITSCQYLELVNFILGKDYDHLLNDNLAETTVGSDGKMISTQKHHASRVRSHVKKFLKRHVIKDMKRYTEEERNNIDEFRYRMALHDLVMNCAVKKPFESKVSVALMELQNVKYALLKQAEFFTFKEIRP